MDKLPNKETVTEQAVAFERFLADTEMVHQTQTTSMRKANKKAAKK